jgi:cyanophycin synthetase
LVQRGTLVLNGADAVLMQAAQELGHVQALFKAGRVALFAHDHEHPQLQNLRNGGGSTCGVQAGRLLLAHAGQLVDLGAVGDFPLSLGGAARHNTENMAAAVLLALALKLPLAAVKQTLLTFGAQASDNPGRLERWTHRGATVLIDYAHNPDGLAQLLTVAQVLRTAPSARLGLLLGQAGNRDDAAIRALAMTAARFKPDRIVIKELPAMLRGRAWGEVADLLERTLEVGGIGAEELTRIDDEADASRFLLAWAQPGDVLVLPIHTRQVRDQIVAVLRDGLEG